MKNRITGKDGKYRAVALCAVLLVGGVVWAQFGPDFQRQGRGGFGGPDNQSFEFIQSFDANGDGVIDKTEFLKASQALFDLMDLSGDGKIDAEEARRDPAAIYSGQSRWAAGVIERYDADEDGKISPTEAPFGAMTFARADINKDGYVDRRELTQMAFENAMVSDGLRMADNNVRIAQAFLKKYDKNHDGKIGADEFEWGPDMFKRFDRNGDKFLDVDEIGRIPPLPRSPKAQAREMIKERDKDKNGQLSADESGFPPEWFQAADLNADGQLSLDELATAIMQQSSPAMGKPQKRLDVAPEPPGNKNVKPGAEVVGPPMPQAKPAPGEPVPPPAAPVMKPVAP